jgi:hypothetical protein
MAFQESVFKFKIKAVVKKKKINFFKKLLKFFNENYENGIFK